MKTNQNSGFIPPHGGYEKLLSYQKAEIIYDGTLCFIDRFISKHDRTYDQMKQAARSGKQNIAEGSLASGTSKQTEIALTNVARASLEELMLDYKDFIRKRKLELWDKNHRFTKNFVKLTRHPMHTMKHTKRQLKTRTLKYVQTR